MVDDWLPVLFKVAIAVGLGAIVYAFLPNTISNTVSTTVNHFLGNISTTLGV